MSLRGQVGVGRACVDPRDLDRSACSLTKVCCFLIVRHHVTVLTHDVHSVYRNMYPFLCDFCQEHQIRTKLEERLSVQNQSKSVNHSPLATPRKYDAHSTASNQSFSATARGSESRKGSADKDLSFDKERDSGGVPLPALSSHGMYRRTLSSLDTLSDAGGFPTPRRFLPARLSLRRRDSSISDLSELPYEHSVRVRGPL